MPADTKLTDQEIQKIFDQIQQNAAEMFTLLIQSQAEVAKLRAQNAMLSAALALLEKGRAA